MGKGPEGGSVKTVKSRGSPKGSSNHSYSRRSTGLLGKLLANSPVSAASPVADPKKKRIRETGNSSGTTNVLG